VVLPSKCPTFPSDEQELNKLLEACYVGYHKNVQVTFGSRDKLKFLKLHDPNQIIDQVFCAAMNVGQGTSGWQNSQSTQARQKASFILKAAYDGTYLTAIDNDRKNIFLTSIGGGVFGNDQKLIYQAILNAHQKWGLHKNSSLEKVSVVLYDSSVPEWVEDYLIKYRINYNIIYYKDGKLTNQAPKYSKL